MYMYIFEVYCEFVEFSTNIWPKNSDFYRYRLNLKRIGCSEGSFCPPPFIPRNDQ